MPLRKLGRHPEQLGTLSMFAAMDRAEPGRSLQDVERQQEVLERMRRGLSDSLTRESRLHGWRVQALFEAIVVELGAVRLLKAEDDEGACWFPDDAPVKLPDFRLVTAEGEHIVVEVKAVEPAKLADGVGRVELATLRRYAELTGARVLFAHYWAKANLWTLSDPDVYEYRNGAAQVTLETAIKANEMGSLGDSMLGTTFPLVLRLRANPAKPRSLASEDEPGVGLASFVIGEVAALNEGRKLIDPGEERLALFLMYFGGWEASQEAQVEDGELVAVDFSFQPIAEARADPPPAMVGTVSSMYSTFFNLMTLDDEGKVSKLRHEPSPGRLADLVPGGYWERDNRQLPLWRFIVQPSVGPRAQR